MPSSVSPALRSRLAMVMTSHTGPPSGLTGASLKSTARADAVRRLDRAQVVRRVERVERPVAHLVALHPALLQRLLLAVREDEHAEARLRAEDVIGRARRSSACPCRSASRRCRRDRTCGPTIERFCDRETGGVRDGGHLLADLRAVGEAGDELGPLPDVAWRNPAASWACGGGPAGS